MEVLADTLRQIRNDKQVTSPKPKQNPPQRWLNVGVWLVTSTPHISAIVSLSIAQHIPDPIPISKAPTFANVLQNYPETQFLDQQFLGFLGCRDLQGRRASRVCTGFHISGSRVERVCLGASIGFRVLG